MTEIVRTFWALNWKWAITIIFFGGLNVGIAQMQLADKPSKEETRTMIKEEIEDNPHIVILETKLEVISTTLKSINKKLDEK